MNIINIENLIIIMHQKNKKKEQKRQHLKKNKGKLNRLQQLEEKLFTHADLLRSAIFERTSRVPDGIFYT